MSCELALHNDEMYNQQPYIFKDRIYGVHRLSKTEM